MAKIIIITGVVLIILGIVLLGIQKLPFGGKLPGDILIKRENFTFYLPLTTCIIISLIFSIILYLIGKFK
ncbi:MAG TPA: DUF2905 domain-containing protein [Nitrospirota bacterium]|nr:DUF2905 domain-containing protein [Nitrospirota bacterium]